MGGAQKATTEFIGRLKERNEYEITFIDAFGALPGHKVWVTNLGIKYIALNRSAKLVTIGGKGQRGLRCIRLIRAIPEMFVVVKRLRGYLRNESPDVILVISFKALFFLKLTFSKLNARVFYWCHGNHFPKVLKHFIFVGLVDKYFCLSQSVKSLSVKAGFRENKITILPNAIDVDVITRRSEGPLQGPLPDQDKPIRLLLPATLLPLKGQDCSIRALGRLVRGGYDAILYLAGDCGRDEFSFKEKLISIAKKECVGDRVHFLGWRSDVPMIMRYSTALVLPSHSEGMPLCILEAMALKLPVIATDVGSINEMLCDDKFGYTFNVNDDYQLMRCILSVHTNKEEIKKIINSAKNYISYKYSNNSQIKCFIDAV